VRRAAAISDRAVQAGIAAVGDGVTERAVAAAVYHELVRAGSDPPGMAPFIRARDRLLQEHVTWSDHALGPGDALFMELSASVGRYHAPLSRMVYLDRAPAGTDRAAEIALGALEAVRAALRPGAVSADVYAAWQRVVDEGLGHSRYRRHHCGYLVGIGFQPSWVGGSAVVGIRSGGVLVVREGMVFHVLSWLLDQEPADYVVSDTILVTADGGEVLTTTPREPLVVR
jgi:Xaa-Pro dipeptidase